MGKLFFNSWQGKEFFYSTNCPDQLWCPTILLMGTWGSLFGDKVLGNKADYFHLVSRL
jgi:hypothetical protein